MRRSRMRLAVRSMRKTLAKKDAQAAAALLPETFSIVDRAARWGIIKDNTAARYKAHPPAPEGPHGRASLGVKLSISAPCIK